MNETRQSTGSGLQVSDRFEQLLIEARNGSREALGELLEQCRPYLLLVANQDLDPALKVKSAASDLVQETLLTAQEKIGDFRGHESGEWLAWLRGILANDVRQAGRKYRGTAKRKLDREIPLAGDSTNTPPDVIAGQPTPGTQSAANEEAAALARAVATLSEDDREAVRLRNWEKLTFEEIGNRMNRSAEAARKLWSRAIHQLKLELNPGEESDENNRRPNPR